MLLCDELIRFCRDWKQDLRPRWQELLRHVEPDSSAVSRSLIYDASEPIYPARMASRFAQARPDAHVFRAFDQLDPADVRCVLLGQDPYPKIEQATGRSFEQGDARTWRDVPLARSLKMLLPMAAEARSGDASYRQHGGFRRATDIGGPITENGPQELFDKWQANGVLCLNVGLTISRYFPGGAPEQLRGHIPFWAPVVGAILQKLVVQANKPVVFLLMGKPAKDLADNMGIRRLAESNGSWGRYISEVRLDHPASTGFTSGRNPFADVNVELAKMNCGPINW